MMKSNFVKTNDLIEEVITSYDKMSSIKEMYEEVMGEEKELENLSEIFYCGSPDASILVVSEAPTKSSSNRKETLFDIIEDEKKLDKTSRREYPFNYPPDSEEDKRNTLYKVFVDEVLDFVHNKEENIGFTDVSEEPLGDKENYKDLDDKLGEEGKEMRDNLKNKIKYLDPEIVVCNKKNVSTKVLDKLNDEECVLDYDNDKVDTSRYLVLDNEEPKTEVKVIFSSSIHVQMSKFSRKRVSREIKKICRALDSPLISD